MRIHNHLVPEKLQVADKVHGLVEIGRISVGDKAETQHGKSYPTSIDHFRIRSEHQQDVFELYGDRPHQLPITFYSDDENEACSERLEIRNSAGKLYGYGDGSQFWFYSDKTQRYTTQVEVNRRPTILEDTIHYLQKGLTPKQAQTISWKRSLTIRFLIRDLALLGYWQFTSFAVQTTIPNLRTAYDRCLTDFGTVAWLPFLLTVKKVQSHRPGQAIHYPVVSLIPQFSFEQGRQMLNEGLQRPHAPKEIEGPKAA